jgi:HK97 family phage prohead protease
MPEQFREMAPLTRSFEVARNTINEESRTVEVVFSTETAEVERYFGIEVLDHSPQSVRMGRLQNKAAVLFNHDFSDQRGVVESATLANKQGIATLRISRSAKGEELFNDIRDGIVSKVSVGYRVHGMQMENSRDGMDSYRVTDWEPFEISFVSIPADDSAGVRDASTIFGKRAAQLSTKIRMENTDNPTDTEDDPALATATETTDVTEGDDGKRNADPNPKLIEDAVQRALAAEDARQGSIRAAARVFGISDDELFRAIANKKLSADDFSRALIEKRAKENKPFMIAPTDINENKSQPGTRAYTLETWAGSAKAALGERGKILTIPDYSRETQVERKYIGDGENQFHRSMAGSLTLIDVVKLDAGIGAPVIDEVILQSKEVSVFPVDVIQGATVELSVMVGTPTVGFRNANEGTSFARGEFESRIFQSQVIEQPIQVDIQGVLNASKDPGRVLFNHVTATTRAVLNHIGRQTWYAGTAQVASDPKAAPGIVAQSNSAATHVVDATGSSAKSSVWFLQLGVESVDHIYGNDTTLTYGSEWTEETVYDANNKALRALVNMISGRVAPRVANKNAAVRIKNLAASTQVLSDALMYQALEKCEVLGMVPNAIFMNPRSLYQLRAGRTATTVTGQPAPLPTDWNGIPIYSTTNISVAETV